MRADVVVLRIEASGQRPSSPLHASSLGLLALLLLVGCYDEFPELVTVGDRPLVRMMDKRVVNVRSAMYAPEGDNLATADLTVALLQAGADARGQLGAFGSSLKKNGSRIIHARVIESSDLRSPQFCLVSIDSLGQPVNTLVVVKQVPRGSLGLYLTREFDTLEEAEEGEKFCDAAVQMFPALWALHEKAFEKVRPSIGRE